MAYEVKEKIMTEWHKSVSQFNASSIRGITKLTHLTEPLQRCSNVIDSSIAPCVPEFRQLRCVLTQDSPPRARKIHSDRPGEEGDGVTGEEEKVGSR